MAKPKHLGHVVIKVRDLERSENFYTDVLGLRVTNVHEGRKGKMVFMSALDDKSHELAILGIGPEAADSQEDQVGMWHFAWEMDTFEDMKELYGDLKRKGVKIEGVADHGISIGVYFYDPDGNAIEAFYEMPKSTWPDGDLFAGKFPMSLEEEPATATTA